MAYATVDDLQSRMVYAMSAQERGIAEVLLEDASNKIDAEYERHGKTPDWESDVTDRALVRICCALVARVLSTSMQTDEQFYQSDAPQFTQVSSFYDGSGILRLTGDERNDLGLPYKRGGLGFASF